MPDFLTMAACRGRRPQRLTSRRHFPRPDLVAKLLRERHVARFVVAPDGFGKTGVALEYCETVFHFEHVFWLDGKSPCFLRDLDDDVIADTLMGRDPDPFLVVFEDVGPLDPERVDKLSAEMDRLLERGCEVLATCVPSCDAFERHHDRIKLTAADLMLTDEEMDILRTPAERNDLPAAAIPSSCRVAGLAWGHSDGQDSFLVEALREELPADLLLPMFVMLALQEGKLEDVTVFGPFEADQKALLADQYPYLGVDLRLERFEAAPFEVSELAEAFSRKMAALAVRSSFAGRDVLSARIADALIAHGRFERACDFARLFVSRSLRATWLMAHGRELFDAVCLVPACEVYGSLAGELPSRSTRLDVDEACRRAMLGDREAACTAARRVVGCASAPVEDRAVGAFVLADCSEGSERKRAGKLVSSLVAASKETYATPSAEDVSWLMPAEVRVALEISCADGAETWLSWYEGGARGRAVAQSAALVLRCASNTSPLDISLEREGAKRASIERVASIVRRHVARLGREGLSLLDALVGISYERACERGAVALPSLDALTSHAVHRLEMALFSQRNVNEHVQLERAERRRSFVATHPDSFRHEQPEPTPALRSTPEPTLTVNLFGGLEVRIGDERVDPSRFRRQKVKTLLALLVLNRGREFSRDKLVSLLWPDSDLEAARKNFYGIWSMLRRALMTPAGTCPYLIRQQNGLRLDARLLSSDVMQLDDVCRSLMFERPGFGGWPHLFSQVNDIFSDDLLPSDSENDAVAAMRANCRDRLVDSLVAASTRLVEAGEVQEGLWFARAALQRDRTREDAYVTLMSAQLAAGQRTAALETYFSCRRFLTDELGIDPSAETMRLYHSIIETETTLE